MPTRKVKIWNDHTRDYTESFRDASVTVPAKKFIVMEEPDAMAFVSQYTPVRRDGQGRDLAPKMLRTEIVSDSTPITQFSDFQCMACKKDFRSQNELDIHISDNHLDAMLDKEAKASALESRTAS